MPKYYIETDETTMIRIKLLGMYFTDEQKRLAEREGIEDMAIPWDDTKVVESLVRDQIGYLSDEDVDFDPYYKQLMDKGIVNEEGSLCNPV